MMVCGRNYFAEFQYFFSVPDGRFLKRPLSRANGVSAQGCLPTRKLVLRNANGNVVRKIRKTIFFSKYPQWVKRDARVVPRIFPGKSFEERGENSKEFLFWASTGTA